MWSAEGASGTRGAAPHVSKGTSVIVARPGDSSDVVDNIKRLPRHREKAGNDAIGLFQLNT